MYGIIPDWEVRDEKNNGKLIGYKQTKDRLVFLQELREEKLRSVMGGTAGSASVAGDSKENALGGGNADSEGDEGDDGPAGTESSSSCFSCRRGQR